LRGLLAALEASSAERVLILACDLPFVNADLLLALTAWPEAQVVAPRSVGRAEPLCAIYRREEVLERARERFAAEKLGLRDLLETLEHDFIEAADLDAIDPRCELLRRVDTREDLAQIELLIER
jgi:molybdopterin-guanine dinucleotide biosynthesis protein A